MRTAVRTVSLELATPLRISRSVMARRDAVWFSIEHAGATGHGEVVSSVHLGITARSARRYLTEHVAPALERRADPLSDPAFPGPDLPLPPDIPAGISAAVDAALLDLRGKLTGRAVHRLLPGADPTVPSLSAATAHTIGITDPGDAAERARSLVDRGFRLLKLKLGTPDPVEDLERVAAVLEAAPGVRLLLDPNGAWTPERAERLIPRFALPGVEAVEQPIAPGDHEAFIRLAECSPLPLIADEDAADHRDAVRLAGRVGGVNIKLAKCGGVRAALRIIDALAGSGTDIMLGCLTASSLGIAPAVHLADRARWVDLDGHLLLARDPWRGIGGGNGTVGVGDLPGLGVTPVGPLPSADPFPERSTGKGGGPA
ncbi:dipeptide epimerase [Streptomyces sp. ST2-7A]|uniref:dipeptide epimerase n=1 Tax=Streptomyces sp. ST2-7A TaxID=2907214 RepID=UPI001F35B3C3|nr:dipeptide epimerase [Streptomyces sp. ST2-7A]MCE7079459.1 dipeptide epimerase [Streptomyces sp. ST2-7A]